MASFIFYQPKPHYLQWAVLLSGGVCPLLSLLPRLMSAKVSQPFGQLEEGVAAVIEVDLVCAGNPHQFPLHPYIWTRKKKVIRARQCPPPWELITALFPITRMVSFLRPGSVSLSISLWAITLHWPQCQVPGTLCEMSSLFFSVSGKKVLMFPTARGVKNYYRPIFIHLFLWCWWWSI